MSTRLNPWSGLGVRAKPSRLTASMTWDQMTAFHSSGRNNAVVQTLVNAVAVKQMRAFSSLSFSASLQPDAAAYDDDDTTDDLTSVDASLQLPGGKTAQRTIPAQWEARLNALNATQDVRDKFQLKATRSVEAHCMPCTVAINGARLDRIIEEALIGAPSGRRNDGIIAARTPFAYIDPLPLIFNECDSHAEKIGLKSALLSACQTIAYGLSSPSPRQVLDRVHNGYERWKQDAVAALGQTIKRNQELLAKAHKSGDVFEIISREAKITILEGYRSDTQSVAPTDLTAGSVTHLFSQVSHISRAP